MGTEHTKVDTQQHVIQRTTTAFSYLVAGGEQTAFEWVAAGNASKRIVGSLDFVNVTGATVIVRVYEKIDGTNYKVVDTKTVTIATDPPTAHFDFESFRSVKVTMHDANAEAISVPRSIDVIQVAV